MDNLTTIETVEIAGRGTSHVVLSPVDCPRDLKGSTVILDGTQRVVTGVESLNTSKLGSRIGLFVTEEIKTKLAGMRDETPEGEQIYETDGATIIILHDNGGLFTNQVSGKLCDHPMVRGYAIPLTVESDGALCELGQQDDCLPKFWTQERLLNLRNILESDFVFNSLFGNKYELKPNPKMEISDDGSGEAWIHGDFTDHSGKLHRFVLTYTNSD